MKLSQGEYVALEKIENTYTTCPIVAQIYIHGDSLQSFLVGIIIPDPVQLAGIVSTLYDKKVAPDNVAALSAACGDPRVTQYILDMLTQEGKRNNLKGYILFYLSRPFFLLILHFCRFENVKRIHVSLNAFTVEDNTMTPTMKIRRKDAYNKFKRELDALYALGEASSTKF
jgi:long-chain acyl-CoA synthetase